jgi:hypothetical protein
MAATFLNFEDGVDEAAFTAVGTTGADQVANSTGSMAYDAITLTGWGVTRAIRVTPSATAGANYAQRTTGLNTATLAATVGVTIPTVTSPGGLALIWVGIDGTTRSFAVGLDNNGKLVVQNAAGTVVWTAAAVFPANTQVRINVSATPGATTGTVNIAYYTGTGTAAIQSANLTGQALGAGNFGAIRFGKASTGAYATQFWFYRAGWDPATTTFISAPAPTTTPPPYANLVPSGNYLLLDSGTSTDYTSKTISPTTGVITQGDYYLVPIPDTTSVVYTLTAVGPGGTSTDDVTVDPLAPPAGGVVVYYFDGTNLIG